MPKRACIATAYPITLSEKKVCELSRTSISFNKLNKSCRICFLGNSTEDEIEDNVSLGLCQVPCTDSGVSGVWFSWLLMSYTVTVVAIYV